jgi:hypothetical protein
MAVVPSGSPGFSMALRICDNERLFVARYCRFRCHTSIENAQELVTRSGLSRRRPLTANDCEKMGDAGDTRVGRGARKGRRHMVSQCLADGDEQPSPNVPLRPKSAATWKIDRTSLLHAPSKVRDHPVETDLPGKLLTSYSGQLRPYLAF